MALLNHIQLAFDIYIELYLDAPFQYYFRF